MKTIHLNLLAGGYDNIFNTHLGTELTPYNYDFTHKYKVEELKKVALGKNKNLTVWALKGDYNYNLNPEICETLSKLLKDHSYCLISQYQKKLNITLFGYIKEL